MPSGTRSFADVFDLATKAHEAGKASEAEALYRELLGTAPNQPDVLAYLAGLLAETGREAEAAELLERALKTDCSHARAHAQRDRLRFLERRAADPAMAI